MIFKTFNSDIDKISAKWGIFGRSFNDIGTAITGRISDINKAFQATDDLIGSIKDSDNVWKRLYPSKESIKDQLIDVDSLIPEIDKNKFDFDFWIDKLNDIDKKVKENKLSWQDFSDTLDDNQKWIAKWGEETQGSIRTQEDLVKANQSAREAAIAHNNALKQQTLSAKAGQLALKGLALAGNMLAFMLIGEVMSLVVKGIKDLANAQENAIEKANEFISKFEEQRDTLASNKKTIYSISSDYEKLSKGIDSLGRNVSLNTDEYARYNDIVNQIADMFPHMVQGYTDEGNAIIAHKGNVEELTKAYEEQKKAAQDAIIVGSADVFAGFKAATDKTPEYTWEESGLLQMKELVDKIVATGGDIEKIQEVINGAFENSLVIGDVFDKIGLDKGWFDWNTIDAEYISENIKKFQSLFNTLNTEVKTQVAKIKPIMQAYLEQSYEYQRLDEDVQDIVKQIVGQFDSEFYAQFGNETEMAAWITDNIINRFNGKDGKKMSSEFQMMLGIQTQFNNGEIAVSEYKEKLSAFLETIEPLPDETEKYIRLLFGIQTNDDGITTSDVDTMVENVKKKLKDTEFDDKVGELSLGDLKIAADLEVGDDTIQSWDDLIERIEKVKTETFNNKTDTSFTKTLSALDQLTSSFDQLDKIYADVLDKGSFDFGSLIDEDFVAKFGSYKEEYNNFIKTISNSPTDINACQGAFNKLVSAWINGTGVLDNLTEENKNLTIAYLEQNGVSNASEIVTQRLARQKEELAIKEQFCAEVGEDLKNVTSDQIEKFWEHSTATETARQYLFKLISEEQVFNNQKLDTSDKINKLEELAEAFGNVELKAFIARRQMEITTQYESMLKTPKRDTSSPESIISGLKFSSVLKSYQEANDYRVKAEEDLLKEIQDKKNNNKIEIDYPVYTGGSASQSVRDKKDKSSSSKDHETNDNYYNPYQPIIDDLKSDKEKFEKELESLNSQIENAYEKGNLELAKNLADKQTALSSQYQSFLSTGADNMRNMAKEQILPIIYQIAPELKGKSVDEFTNKELQKIQKRLDDNIYAQKNKVIDLENANKANDSDVKVSDVAVKSAEQQLTIFNELKSTLEEINTLSGQENGQGEWAASWSEVVKKAIETVRNTFDKSIEQDEFAIDILGSNGNYEGQIAVYKTMLTKYHDMAEEYRSKGFTKNSQYIQEMQKGYADIYNSILEAENKLFDKSKELKEDDISTIQFRIDLLGEDDFEEKSELINKQLEIEKGIVSDLSAEMSRLNNSYSNGTLSLDAYNKRLKELQEQQHDAIKQVQDYYKALKDVEVAKVQKQIDDLTKSYDKETKALEDQLEILEDRKELLEEKKSNYESAYSAVVKTIEDEIEALEKQKEEEEAYWDDKIDALEKENEERTKAIDLMEKQQALAKAQSQATSLIYKDGEMVYTSDKSEVADAQKDLNDWLIDDQYEKAKKALEKQKEDAIQAIDDMIDAWNEYKESWAEAMDYYEDKQNEIMAKQMLGANWESQVLHRRTSIIKTFQNNYSDCCSEIENDIEKEIKELNKEKEALEKVKESEVDNLTEYQEAWENTFDSLIQGIDGWEIKLNELTIAENDAFADRLNNVRSFVDEYNKSMNGLLVSDYKPTVLEQMYANSQSWQYADSSTRNQLHSINMELAKQIGAVYDENMGVWTDINGNDIYDELTETVKDNIKTYVQNTYAVNDSIDANKTLAGLTTANNTVVTKNTSATNTLTNSNDALGKKMNNNSTALEDSTFALDENGQVINKATGEVINSMEELTKALNNSTNNNSNTNTNNTKNLDNILTEIDDAYGAYEANIGYDAEEAQYEYLIDLVKQYGGTLKGNRLNLDGNTYTLSGSGWELKSSNSNSGSNSSNNNTNNSDNSSDTSKMTDNQALSVLKDLYDSKAYTQGVYSTANEGASAIVSDKLLSESNPVMYYVVKKNGSYTTYKAQYGDGINGTKVDIIGAYAKGTKYSPEGFAITDEYGEELKLVKDGQGRIEYLKKGTEVITAPKTKEFTQNIDKLINGQNPFALNENQRSEIFNRLLEYSQNHPILFNPNLSMYSPFDNNAVVNRNIVNNNTTENININKIEVNEANNLDSFLQDTKRIIEQNRFKCI